MAKIMVTPAMLRNTAHALHGHMENARTIANGYLANHENTLGPQTWAGAGSQASYTVADRVHADLHKVLTGGARLADGLTKAAALMESHEADAYQAFHALFNPQPS